jgi:hypothetical protein
MLLSQLIPLSIFQVLLLMIDKHRAIPEMPIFCIQMLLGPVLRSTKEAQIIHPVAARITSFFRFRFPAHLLDLTEAL